MSSTPYFERSVFDPAQRGFLPVIPLRGLPGREPCIGAEVWRRIPAVKEQVPVAILGALKPSS